MPNNTSQEQRPYTFDRVVRLLISAAALILAIWLVNTLRALHEVKYAQDEDEEEETADFEY